MSFRSLAKHAAASLLRPWFGGIGCVMVFHRVVEEGERAVLDDNRAIEITPAMLRAILEWVRRRGFDVIGLDEVPARLRERTSRKFVAFTFDDGYRDNLTLALPIFREFGFPLTIDLTTGYPHRTASVWWYSLETILTRSSSLEFRWEDRAHSWRWSSRAEREAVFVELAALIRSQGRAARDELLQVIAAAASIDPLDSTRALTMDWTEIAQFAADPLVTIGAHTVGHHTLCRLSEEDVRAELQGAKDELAARLDRPIKHLAYPFGGRSAVGAREFGAARACGFNTATTTRTANLFSAHAAHLHALPRWSMSGNHDPLALLARLDSGLAAVSSNGWRRVVTE